MKAYKRKRHITNNTRDSYRCNDLRKSLNSSERWRGKREAVSMLSDDEHNDVPWADVKQKRQPDIVEMISVVDDNIAYNFVCTIRKVAPELTWADEKPSWKNSFQPKGLAILLYRIRNYGPWSHYADLSSISSQDLEEIIRLYNDCN